MKSRILFTLILSTLMLSTKANTHQQYGLFENRFVWGASIEFTGWTNEFPELYWRVGSDCLIPCNKHLSLGAFCGTSMLMWDAGALASWRFLNDSRAIIGVGYSATFDAPLLRLGYKTSGPWYVAGWIGGSPKDRDLNFSLGVGYAFFGGRRR